MKTILLSCVIAFISFKTFAQTTIEAKDAAKHINEKVTICDKVFGGKFFGGTGLTLLDLGGSHPNELLTVVIKAEDRKKFKIAPETDRTGYRLQRQARNYHHRSRADQGTVKNQTTGKSA